MSDYDSEGGGEITGQLHCALAMDKAVVLARLPPVEVVPVPGDMWARRPSDPAVLAVKRVLAAQQLSHLGVVCSKTQVFVEAPRCWRLFAYEHCGETVNIGPELNERELARLKGDHKLDAAESALRDLSPAYGLSLNVDGYGSCSTRGLGFCVSVEDIVKEHVETVGMTFSRNGLVEVDPDDNLEEYYHELILEDRSGTFLKGLCIELLAEKLPAMAELAEKAVALDLHIHDCHASLPSHTRAKVGEYVRLGVLLSSRNGLPRPLFKAFVLPYLVAKPPVGWPFEVEVTKGGEESEPIAIFTHKATKTRLSKRTTKNRIFLADPQAPVNAHDTMKEVASCFTVVLEGCALGALEYGTPEVGLVMKGFAECNC